MNVQTKPGSIAAAQPARLTIVDCDIHPTMVSPDDTKRYLPKAWHDFHDTYRNYNRTPFAAMDPFPGIEPNISRRDSYPPTGGPPGSDLAFMREQHLDGYGVDVGILQPLSPSGNGQRNLDYGAVLATAVNDWQIDVFAGPEPRLKASITVAQDHVEASLAEIRRCANDTRFAQIAMSQRSVEPIGRRRYWPIYELAVENDLAIGIHVGGNPVGPPFGAVGWPSYNIQQHQSVHGGMAALLMSLVMEGVFEEFPKLRVVLVEGAFTWMPSFMWRLDKVWERMRTEVPHVKRRPSEYVRENIWVSTQPVDVFKNPDDLKQFIEWVGWDRMCFATDYPHWDFDDPRYAFPFELSAEQKRAIFQDNARKALRI